MYYVWCNIRTKNQPKHVFVKAKYMKYDEKKEAIHSLKQQFAEFLIQVQTRDDQLQTWCSDSFWAGHDIEKKRAEWLNLEKQLQCGVHSMIDRKANLCCEFEKEMDTGLQKKTALNARKQALDIKLQKIRILKEEIKAAAEENESAEAAKQLNVDLSNIVISDKPVNSYMNIGNTMFRKKS